VASRPAVVSTGSPGEVFGVALRLGLSAFGGPIAHLGYFERTYVRERHWLGADEYAALVALCQLLPGPTSSQVGFLIGLKRAGWRGAAAAWLGFTLPSALLMYAFAMFSAQMRGDMTVAALHGLALAAVAVVAQAVWRMGRALCPDRQRVALALLAALLLLLQNSVLMQFGVMLLGAAGGWLLLARTRLPALVLPDRMTSRAAWAALAAFVLLGVALLAAAALAPHGLAALAAVFYRSGALVFGGGHVVLPLLRDALVPAGWLSDDAFLYGYGLAQALPGPLFTIGAYLGAASAGPGASAGWALTALLAIFLPGLLLAVAGLSLGSRLARRPGAYRVFAGVNAAVVGILGAALYDPVITTGIRSSRDGVIALLAWLLLERLRVAPIAVVALCVLARVVTAL
jgi:chromate transporter